MLQEAELSSQADSENNLGGSSETMYFIGLDVHKRTISYCVKDVAGRVRQEGKIGSTRRELNCWVRTMPQPRMIAMEATIFTGWILRPSASACGQGEGRTPADAAGDRRGQEEER